MPLPGSSSRAVPRLNNRLADQSPFQRRQAKQNAGVQDEQMDEDERHVYGDDEFPENPLAATSGVLTVESVLSGGVTNWKSRHIIDEDLVYNTKRKHALSKRIEGMKATDVANVTEEADTLANDVRAPLENPFVERKVRALLRDWAAIIPLKIKNITRANLWRQEVVSRCAPFFLFVRVSISPGRGNTRFVRAVTLFNWCTILFRCIIRYCIDKDGNSVGEKILLDTSLYERIRLSAKEIIKTRNLIRHQDHKVYLGEWELLLMYSWLLQSSEFSIGFERLVKLQIGCGGSFAFYIITRAGSLAPNCVESLLRQLYMMLGHIKFEFTHGFKSCRAIVDVLAWKGQSESVNATRMTYSLDCVTKSQNVPLDPTLWLLAYMFLRGAFGPKFKTIDDIINYKGAELHVVPEKAEEPFFLAISPGGHNLIQGKPATAQSISANLKHAALAAGLPGGSMHAFRRDGANHYKDTIGSEFARVVMGHNNPGSDTNRTGGSSSAFFRYYDRNLEDTPLSLIRLGELQGKTDDVTREILRKRQFTRPALDTFIHLWSRRNQGTVAATKDLAVTATEDLAEDLAETTPVDTEGGVPPGEQDLLPLLPKYFTAGEGCRLSQAGRLAVLGDKEVTKTRRALDASTERFFDCFPPLARTLEHGSSRTRASIAKAISQYPRPLTSPKNVHEATIALDAAITAEANARKFEAKRVQRAEDKAARAAASDPLREGNTADARNDARDDFKTTVTASILKAQAPHPSIVLAAVGPIVPSPPEVITGNSERVLNDAPPNDESDINDTPPNSIIVPDIADAPMNVVDESNWPADPTIIDGAPIAGSVAPSWGKDATAEQWNEWQRSLAVACELNDAREESMEDEYAFAADHSVMRPVVDAHKKFLKKSKASLYGVHPTQLCRELLTDLGVPPQAEEAHSDNATPDVETTNVPSLEASARPFVAGAPEEDRVELVTGLSTIGVPGVDGAVDGAAASVLPSESVAPDAHQEDVLGLDCLDLRIGFLHRLIDVLERNEKIEANFKANGGKWLCPYCQLFTRSSARSLAHKSRSHLEAHMKLVHTPWHDLELEMWRDGETLPRCPSCSFIGKTVMGVQRHCINDCVDKERYQEMLNAHQVVSNRQRKQPEHRDKRVRRMRRDLGSAADEAYNDRDDDDTIALIIRQFFLSLRDWDVNKVIDDAVASGEIPTELREGKKAALTTVCQFSQDAWEHTDFYAAAVRIPDEYKGLLAKQGK